MWPMVSKVEYSSYDANMNTGISCCLSLYDLINCCDHVWPEISKQTKLSMCGRGRILSVGRRDIAQVAKAMVCAFLSVGKYI